MRYKSMKRFSIIVFIFLLGLLTACSHHYEDGKELEKKERYEEAAIEFRHAYLSDPDDEDYQEALERTYVKVAEENMQRYRDYLEKREYRKAFSRLQEATVQDPDLRSAQEELKLWVKVLISGRMTFEFNRLQANVRLADEMQLQVWLINPIDQVLKADINNDNGTWFVEDLLYRPTLEEMGQYTIETVGLKMVRKPLGEPVSQSFRKFVDFRGLIRGSSTGKLTPPGPEFKQVSDHRPQLYTRAQALEPWVPPVPLNYRLRFEGQRVKVESIHKRLDYLPNVLYVNTTSRRAFVDFGSRHLKLHEDTFRWSITRPALSEANQDYFVSFAKIVAFHLYFGYQGAYRYALAQ